MKSTSTVILMLALVAGCAADMGRKKDITEEELEMFFRQRTVSGNHAVAIKVQFTVPQPGTAFVATIHGYPNNRAVCEDLIRPYNQDPSLTAIPGATYICEMLQ